MCLDKELIPYFDFVLKGKLVGGYELEAVGIHILSNGKLHVGIIGFQNQFYLL